VVRPASGSPAVEPLIQDLIEGSATNQHRIPSGELSILSLETFEALDSASIQLAAVFSIGSYRDLQRVESKLSTMSLRDQTPWVHIPEDPLNEFPYQQYSLGYGSVSLGVGYRVASDDFHNFSFLSGLKLILIPGGAEGWLASSSRLSSILPQSQGTIGEHGPQAVFLGCSEHRSLSFDSVLESIVESFSLHDRATAVLSPLALERLMAHLPAMSPERRSTTTLLASLGEQLRAVLQTRLGYSPSVRSHDLSDHQRQFVRRVSAYDHALAPALARAALQVILGATEGLVLLSERGPGQTRTRALPVDEIPEVRNPMPASFYDERRFMPSGQFLEFLSEVALPQSRHETFELSVS
jgi:hypothetical protein